MSFETKATVVANEWLKNAEDHQKKRRRQAITPDIRRSVWQTHMPPNCRTAKCPVCKENNINGTHTKAGFECAHIVADKYMTKKQPLNPLYLYPTCAACNSACEDDCLLDFLWQQHRHQALQEMMRSIHRTYVSTNQWLGSEERVMWRVMKKLYGYETFPSGGGIINEIPIYRLAQAVELEDLTKQLQETQLTLGRLSESIQLVVKYEVTTGRPRFTA